MAAQSVDATTPTRVTSLLGWSFLLVLLLSQASWVPLDTSARFIISVGTALGLCFLFLLNALWWRKQFSLRSLLFGILIILTAISFAAQPFRVAFTERSHLRTLERAGAKISTAAHGEQLGWPLDRFKRLEPRRVTSVDLSNTKVDDGVLLALTDCPELRTLNLDNSSLPDGVGEYLGHLTRLNRLTMPGTGITDSDTARFGQLTNLGELDLGNNPITDATLVRLQNLPLRRLDLHYTTVTREEINRLRAFLSNKCMIFDSVATMKDLAPEVHDIARKFRKHGIDVEPMRTTAAGFGAATALSEQAPWIIRLWNSAVRRQKVRRLIEQFPGSVAIEINRASDFVALGDTTNVKLIIGHVSLKEEEINDVTKLEDTPVVLSIEQPTDQSVKLLRKVPNLVGLTIRDVSGLTRVGFAAMGDLVGLRFLYLEDSSSPPSEEAFAPSLDLGRLESLKVIRLQGGIVQGRKGRLDRATLPSIGSQLEELSINGFDLDLSSLHHFRGLIRLEVKYGKVHGLEGFVRDLPDLRMLSIGFREHREKWIANDDLLAALCNARNLEWLAVPDSVVTDQGVKAISHHAGLRYLQLCGTQVSDEGMQYLARLRQLKCLYLCATTITDSGLSQLQTLTNLRVLLLSRTRITDESMTGLSKFARLRRLGIKNTGISEADARVRFPHVELTDYYGGRDLEYYLEP